MFWAFSDANKRRLPGGFQLLPQRPPCKGLFRRHLLFLWGSMTHCFPSFAAPKVPEVHGLLSLLGLPRPCLDMGRGREKSPRKLYPLARKWSTSSSLVLKTHKYNTSCKQTNTSRKHQGPLLVQCLFIFFLSCQEAFPMLQTLNTLPSTQAGKQLVAYPPTKRLLTHIALWMFEIYSNAMEYCN